jgi:hypothetical protein
VHGPAAQGDGQWPAPGNVSAKANLFDEADGVMVPSEEVVVELVEPHSRLDLVPSGEATRKFRALDQYHRLAPLCEPVRNRQTQRTGANDDRTHEEEDPLFMGKA